MNPPKRLTRQENKGVTRARLIDAAEKVVIGKGFDDATVEEITESAGYSRGAFYSNFADKDELFLAVFDRYCLDVASVLEDTFRRISDPAKRVAAVRPSFSDRARLKKLTTLRMEFSRRAMKNVATRNRLADLWRKEVETYAAWVEQAYAPTGVRPPGQPETIALALLAVIYGLGTIALDSEPEMERSYDEAAKLVFDRLTGPENYLTENGNV